MHAGTGRAACTGAASTKVRPSSLLCWFIHQSYKVHEAGHYMAKFEACRNNLCDTNLD